MGAVLAVVSVAAVVACIVVARRWRTARRELARVRATFERYVAPSVVDEILKKRDARIFSGRHLNATVLVCKIWNFSLLMEDLTPEETLRYLNEFYAIAGTSVQKHRGIVTQFAADGIVGAFGAPLEDPVQDDHATRAAIEIVRLFSAMEARWTQQGRRSLRVGIGIASGEAIAGDAGFRQRREYTVVGNVVSLAHRLQETTNEINASIVVSAATARALGDDYQLVHVRDYPVRGLRRMVDAFIVRSRRGTERPIDLPAAQQFARTALEPAYVPQAPAPEPPSATAREYVAPPAADAAFHEHRGGTAPEPASRDIVVAEPARPRAQRVDARLSDLVFPEYLSPDAAPEYPDPPLPRATYEDGAGPPLDL